MATVVMTGGSSGFGAHAAAQLRANGASVLLGARRSAEGALALDLTSFASVRSFAAEVGEVLGHREIDALALNAGIVRADVQGRTADGFETTFAVNHLAHHLLLRLLLPRLAKGATVTLTTSGTHDPDTGAELTPPRHADAVLLAHPDRDPHLEDRPAKAGQHAYTASKLCVVMTALALAARSGCEEMTVVAYCPGQVFGTGLARGLSPVRRTVWRVMGTPVSRPLRRVVPTLNSSDRAGEVLADLVGGTTQPPQGRTYAALRRGRLTWPEPSQAAKDDRAVERLWSESARLAPDHPPGRMGA